MDIGRTRIDREMAEQVQFPVLVDRLAVKAFHEQWEEGTDTRAIRRALDLFQRPGAPWVSPEEPGVG